MSPAERSAASGSGASAPSGAPAAASTTPVGGPTRILLVEDEENFRDPLAYGLRRDGFEVIEAEDGQRAVEIFEASRRPGGVRMDVERHEVRVDGEVVAMPLREFELLELFLRHPGRVLTRRQILERLWGPDYEGDTKTLDVHIKRLRGRIEADASKPVLITTVRGLGYRLDGDSEH